MTRFIVPLLAVCCLLVSASTSDAQSRRRKGPPPSKPARIEQSRVELVPRLMGGLLIGEAADAFETADSRASDKLFYGGGLSLEYYLQPRIAIATNIDLVWKYMPWESVNSIRTISLSISGMYRFAPTSRRSIYLRPDLGLISGKLPDYFGTPVDGSDDLSFGTRLFFRLGLGLHAYTSGSINTRFEIFYKHVFSDGGTIGQLNDREIDINVDGIGVEFAVGVPLKKMWR